MPGLVDVILVFVVLANLTLLGSNRLATCIQLIAVQGMALGVLPLVASHAPIGMRVLGFALVSFVIKGILFPALLRQALRSASVRHEVDPLVGYATSILMGVLMLGVSFWLSSRFNIPRPAATSSLALPVAISTVLIGLFLIVTRNTALMQVVGYLVLENGIYICGVALAYEQPLLVEMGVLLDIFAAVFVMGIAIFHISREFDHIDTDQLSTLKD